MSKREWKISPVVAMQNWPLLCATVSSYESGDDSMLAFQITGTDAAEIQAMAEKVKSRLELEKAVGTHE